MRTPIACLAAVVVIAGCTTVVDGRALSILNDPFRVGGLPATNGPSGARPDAPAASGTVINTNNGAIDKLSLLSVNDIEDYWMAVYSESLKGTFRPVANLVTRKDPTIVREQQADCFAGVYLWWVAEGKSTRFTLSTADGIDHVLAGIITTRDPVMEADAENDDEHGSALDRVSAFQLGFINGTPACAAIDEDEVERRRGDLPTTLRVDASGNPETGEVGINEETLSTLMELMGKIFSPKNPPTLSYQPAGCPDAKPSPPAAYCPATNTIVVDLPALARMGKVASAAEHSLPQGDDTSLSIVMSRYALAVQHERGLPMQSPWTALRTACLTGVAHRKMAVPIDLPSGQQLVLTAGDLDEAVSGLLTNRMVASDADGVSVPAGFTRIAAFRAGVGGDMDACYARYPG